MALKYHIISAAIENQLSSEDAEVAEVDGVLMLFEAMAPGVVLNAAMLARRCMLLPREKLQLQLQREEAKAYIHVGRLIIKVVRQGEVLAASRFSAYPA